MTAGEVFDVLVEHCGAHESDRESFLHHWPACREFRFMGSLGMGGKVYNSGTGTGVWVDCYAEDVTAERIATIDKVNMILLRMEAAAW